VLYPAELRVRVEAANLVREALNGKRPSAENATKKRERTGRIFGCKPRARLRNSGFITGRRGKRA
jgi:hypothetical protein